MKRNQKLVILSRLANSLIERGSWTGEMHLQKAVYLLEEVTGLPLGYQFVLYHYGPFSFELRQELNRMRADGLLELVPKPYPYGPSFGATEPGIELEKRFPKTLGRVERQVEFVADVIGSRSASVLERLGTAVYLLKSSPSRDLNQLALMFNQLKPHVSVDAAHDALQEMQETIADAPVLGG